MVAATAAPRDPVRPPLFPSEKDNAALPRRPRTKEITSRYLTTHSPSSSSSTSTSSSSSSRRFPSPLLTPRPAARPATPKRSHSVDRARPSTPTAEPSAAARALCTTTRSLSVSFQGESFFYQTSRTKAASPNPARKLTPERRRPTASLTAPVKPPDQSENSKPFDHRRWPAAKALHSNPLMRSLDCSLEPREPIMAAVRLLNQFEDTTRRASFDGGDLSASSDTDSVSSGSNSGAPEARHTSLPRGISVPARFWQETNGRLRRLPQPSTTLAAPPKLIPVKKSLGDSPLSSPRSMSSPLRGPARSSSPSKLSASPSSRGAASPLKTRSGVAMGLNAVRQQPGNAPSILSFSAEVRRAKKGENRIEEAHSLRLFHNRELQWRWVNARAGATLSLHRLTAEKNVYDAWVTISDLRDSVMIKRIKLHLLRQNMKLISILMGQTTYLEEWPQLERDHSSSLSGTIEALKASTLRLPIVSGAKADILEVKHAVGSAVDVMQAMGSSICSLLSKVEGASYLVPELAKVAAQECALLYQSRELLSTVAAMNVKQCSLRGHILQLKCKPSKLPP
ncbi:hypothetical protein J5N97_015683 [Dioscorea zingiberensis]|uniref:QWRF motif-containing protein 2 n=1 Tax=Dioscorea zingiberensis TaxID=325984 RepID=A0A9D5CJM3_9LILI|nr:hypothetical protein J5N97_015683 [Dioscorea zingiberensis]